MQLQQGLSLKSSEKWALLLVGEVSDKDVEVGQSDDKLDGTGAGSSEDSVATVVIEKKKTSMPRKLAKTARIFVEIDHIKNQGSHFD